MNNTQRYVIAATSVIFLVALCLWASSKESFVTPKHRQLNGRAENKNPNIPASSFRQEPKLAPYFRDSRPAQHIDLVETPALAHSGGRMAAKECHALCDPDGTCHSRAFYECLQQDPSRFGTPGRERNAYDSEFRRVQYNALSPGPRT